MNITPAMLEVALARWPNKPPLIAAEVPDIRPYVELQNLILATDAEGAPEFCIVGSTVIFALRPFGLGLILTSENPDTIIQSLLHRVLEYRSRL
ncbi:MAG: hypothetical protein HC888_05265 [Candidatus Competibacteraceae bacterium]|nr:hypothetical protein [Candidatus Competibacteraceae bacterium]